MVVSRPAATRARTPPTTKEEAISRVWRKSCFNSLRNRASCCFRRFWASLAMPVTSPVRPAFSGVCRSVAMRSTPGRGGAGEQESNADTDEHRRDRVSFDQIADILGHAREPLFLEVLATALQSASNLLGSFADPSTRRVFADGVAKPLHPASDPAGCAIRALADGLGGIACPIGDRTGNVAGLVGDAAGDVLRCVNDAMAGLAGLVGVGLGSILRLIGHVVDLVVGLVLHVCHD